MPTFADKRGVTPSHSDRVVAAGTFHFLLGYTVFMTSTSAASGGILHTENILHPEQRR